MAGDLHNVEDVDAGQVHQRGTGAAGSVGVDQFALFDLLLAGCPAAGGLYLDQLGDTGIAADLLDVSVDDLVFQVGHLVVIFLQNGFELRGARDGHLGAGFLLADMYHRHIFGQDGIFLLAGVLRIIDLVDIFAGVGLNVLAGDIVVV